MRQLGIGKTGLCMVLAVLGLVSWLHAKEITINSQSATNPATNTYRTLEEFRQALTANPGLLASGDVISLHNNDTSLSNGLELPNGVSVTLRSVGGRHTIGTVEGSAANTVVNVESVSANAPRLILENVRLADSSVATAAIRIYTTGGSAPAMLEIKNSVIENNADTGRSSVWLRGDAQGTITNSVFANNYGSFAGAVLLSGTGTGTKTQLDLVFDENASPTTTWSGNTYLYGPKSIYMIANTGDQVELNVAVAGNKVFYLADQMQGDLFDDSSLTINKTGAGSWKLDGNTYMDVNGTNATVNFTVNEGILHLKETFRWHGGTTDDENIGVGNLHIAKDGIFKPSIYIPTDYSHHNPDREGNIITGSYSSGMALETFTSAEGAKLYVGGVSKFPLTGDMSNAYKSKIWFTAFTVTDTDNSNIASTMTINNKLMSATLDWDASDPTAGVVTVNRVNNMSSLFGVGPGMDIYRKRDDLPEAIRDWLDDVYARGGNSPSDLSFMQTVNGDVVMLTQLAMRNNLAGMLKRISRRTTAYQDEELGISGAPCGTSNTERGDYGELWAYIDQTWHKGNNGADFAGYTYNPSSLGIGYDHHSDQIIFGGLLNLDTGDVKLRSGGKTRTEVTSAIGGVYASYATEGIYLTGGLQAGYSWNKSKSHYEVLGFRANANSGTYGTHLLGANAEVGYMMELTHDHQPLRVTPYAGLSYARINREAFREHGAGDMDRQFSTSKWDMFDVTLGVRASKPMTVGGMTVIPSLDAAFVRTIGAPGEENGKDAHFVDSPLGFWRISTYHKNHNALRLGGGVTAKVRDNLDVGLDYDFEWRTRYTSHQLNLNMSLGF